MRSAAKGLTAILSIITIGAMLSLPTSAAYAAEELVAELSSAMLGAELGLPVAHLDSHASYIDHWLKLLREDDRAILTAAARAEEASSLLLKLGGRETAVAEEPGDDALAA